MSDLHNSVLVLEDHSLDLMNLPATGSQRGPPWTTPGGALRYNPSQVWVLGRSASTSASAASGKTPRWASQKSGSRYLLEIKMNPRKWQDMGGRLGKWRHKRTFSLLSLSAHPWEVTHFHSFSLSPAKCESLIRCHFMIPLSSEPLIFYASMMLCDRTLIKRKGIVRQWNKYFQQDTL